MIKSIKLKLWLTLFITLVVSLGAFLSLTYLSVKHRFLDYATNQILERLEPLEQAVIGIYVEANSLQPFNENPSRWSQLRDATYRQYLRDQIKRTSTPFGPRPQDWTDREAMEKKLQPNQRAFFQHLVLYDSQNQLIAGQPKEQANYVLRTLALDGQIIAYIGYVKPKAFLRSVDKLFVDQQIKSFGILSLAMVFAALLVTIFVSRWLVKPLSKLARSAKQVANGDFSVRINSHADDELGKLCENFDEMTSTLEKNEIIRKQWVADISHEMRTPLSVLKAQIEAMEDGIRIPSADNLHLLQRNVNSLSSVIDDLYELSLTDLGVMKLDLEKLSLNGLVEEVLVDFEEKLNKKNLRVSCEFTHNSHSLLVADQKRAKQVIANLLENSYRYTSAQGDIRIKTSETEKYMVIDIEDSAPGVPETALERIYDRLYRVESSRNRETGGAGLGLSICKSIIDGHGGSITCGKSKLGGLKQNICFPKQR